MGATTIEYLWGAVETLSIENQKWMLDRLLEKFFPKQTATASQGSAETAKPAKRKIVISPEVRKLSRVINTHGANLDDLIMERAMEKAYRE